MTKINKCYKKKCENPAVFWLRVNKVYRGVCFDHHQQITQKRLVKKLNKGFTNE